MIYLVYLLFGLGVALSLFVARVSFNPVDTLPTEGQLAGIGWSLSLMTLAIGIKVIFL
tara:strand:+ start:3204 stop:3377 length:174 start_codon:yes stop_codon:yes gene_type:complete